MNLWNKIHWQDENTADGIKRILKWLAHYQVERVLMETTGWYEFKLAQAAYEKKLPVCIVKLLRVKHFAGAIEQLAKTDKIDAALIVEFAFRVQPASTPEKSKNLLAIKDLISRRRQLMNMRSQEMNRSHMELVIRWYIHCLQIFLSWAVWIIKKSVHS